MKTTMKKIAALLLSFAMIVTMLATTIWVTSAEEPDTTAATVNGVALIVDGVEYSSGLVVVNASSKIELKAYGTNLGNCTWQDHKIEYVSGSVQPMGRLYSWTASADGTSTTKEINASGFRTATQAFTIKYTNNGGNTWHNSAVSVLYSNEENAKIESISITVDGMDYTSGEVTVYPYSNVTITANGVNLNKVTDYYVIKYDGVNYFHVRQMDISENGTTATYEIKGSQFAKAAGTEISYCSDYIHSDIWAKSGICVTYDEGEGAMLLGTYINLGGDIEMRYAVWIAKGEDLDSVKIKTVFLGEEKYLTYREKKDDYYVFALEGINPQCLGDDIDAELYLGDEKIDEILDYSVEDYLLALDKSTLSEAAKQVVQDLLAYGTVSEAYTGHKSLSDTYETRETEIPAYMSGVIDTHAGISVYSVNVCFGSTTRMMFRFKSDDGQPIYLAAPIYINGKEAITYFDGDTLIAISNPIAPKDFDEDVSLLYQDSEHCAIRVSISVNDYCYMVTKEGSTASAQMKALALALYNYGASARAYAEEQ